MSGTKGSEVRASWWYKLFERLPWKVWTLIVRDYKAENEWPGIRGAAADDLLHQQGLDSITFVVSCNYDSGIMCQNLYDLEICPKSTHHGILEQVLQACQAGVAVTRILPFDGILEVLQVCLWITGITEELQKHKNVSPLSKYQSEVSYCMFYERAEFTWKTDKKASIQLAQRHFHHEKGRPVTRENSLLWVIWLETYQYGSFWTCFLKNGTWSR